MQPSGTLLCWWNIFFNFRLSHLRSLDQKKGCQRGLLNTALSGTLFFWWSIFLFSGYLIYDHWTKKRLPERVAKCSPLWHPFLLVGYFFIFRLSHLQSLDQKKGCHRGLLNADLSGTLFFWWGIFSFSCYLIYGHLTKKRVPERAAKCSALSGTLFCWCNIFFNFRLSHLRSLDQKKGAREGC